ncbi:putative peptidase (DUF1758) domain-containing protein [Phthorimaea operculella]|nr:putative peptidase (DUF1758) domain-containing protein [Phthorimaea operculella]
MLQRDSAKSLRFLIDHVSKHLRALKTLGEPTESWDTLIIHLISAKLDSSTSFKWEEHKCSIKGSPKLQDFFKFLKGRADIFESLQNNKTERQVNTKSNNSLYSSQPNNKNAKFSYNSNPISTNEKSQPKYFAPEKPLTKCFAVMASNASSLACVLCNGSHRLYDCASFLAKSVEDRTAEAMRLKLCLVCLRSGHTSRQCKLGTCPISDCQSRHNRLLHKDSSVTANTSNVNTTTTYETEFAQESETEDSSVTMTVYANKNNLLSTALVKVYNPNSNEYTTVRALLDAGSQSCLISEDLKNKLQLVPQATRVGIVGIGNVKSSHATQRCNLKIISHNNKYETELECLVVPCVSTVPNRTFDVEHLKIPTDLKLADPNFNVAAPADILIGVDVFWNLIEFGSAPIKLGPKQPMLLPLHTEPDCLGDSFKVAKRQFLALEKRFKKNPELKSKYSEFIKEYGDLEGKLLAIPPNVPSCAAADHDQSEVLELLYPYIAKLFYSFVSLINEWKLCGFVFPEAE